MGGGGILRKVVVLDGEDEARAVRGEIRGASAADGPEVFGSDGAELGCGRGLGGAEEYGRGEESEESEAGQTADEGEKEGCHRKEKTRTITGNENDYAYAGFSKIVQGAGIPQAGMGSRRGGRDGRRERRENLFQRARWRPLSRKQFLFVERFPGASPAPMNLASARCVSITSDVFSPRTMASRAREE